MRDHTVKQIAKLAGISVRTLHHYDRIALLRPARSSSNNYRCYGEFELLRLQQILFYRQLGMPLLNIKKLLDAPDFDLENALKSHREKLLQQMENNQKLIATIDNTLREFKGKKTMTSMPAKDLYEGFTPQKQAEFETWLIEKSGSSIEAKIKHSKSHLAKSDTDAMQQKMIDLADIEAGLAQAMLDGVAPTTKSVMDLLDRHRNWVANMWDRECSLEAYEGLAQTYQAHPEFVARYERLAIGFSNYLPNAMQSYASKI